MTCKQSEPILDIRNLNAFYGHAQALFNVSFQLAAGEALALVGNNGAGKSTTLKAIMALIDRQAETLRFASEDIGLRSTHHIAQLGLGYVPEERRIFTDLTVAENLEVGRLPPRGNRQPWNPSRLYDIFPNLAEMSGRAAGNMSGGEQQMLSIARTLMGNPSAVLLDEPSEGLAPIIVEQMGRAIIAMKHEGIAILLSEQNLAFAASIASRALEIEAGSITFDGPIASLFAKRERS